jgi:hypothetical protein
MDLLLQGLLAKCKVLPKNKRDFPILNDVSGVVRPGRQVFLFQKLNILLFLMNPSIIHAQRHELCLLFFSGNDDLHLL